MIDDYDQAISLVEKMKEHLSVPIYATPRLLKTMEEQGEKYAPNHQFLINHISYAGDEGGITCFLKSEPEVKTVFGASLTHLKVTDDHPLAEEIRSYQKRRTFRLALADGKKVKKSLSVKKKKGFGV